MPEFDPNSRYGDAINVTDHFSEPLLEILFDRLCEQIESFIPFGYWHRIRFYASPVAIPRATDPLGQRGQVGWRYEPYANVRGSVTWYGGSQPLDYRVEYVP